MQAMLLAFLRSARNGLETTSRPKALLVTALTVSFLFTTFFVFWQVVGYLHRSPMVGPALVVRLLSMAYLTFLLMLAFSAIVVSLSTLYASAELPLLLASPVPPAAVFAAKTVEAGFQAGWMVLVASIPILGAYAFEFQASWTFLPAAVLVSVLFVMPPVALGLLLTLAIVRVFSAQRSRDAVLAGGALAVAAALGYFKLLRPAEWVKPGEAGQALQFLAEIAAPMYPWLPSHWATRSLMAALQGDWESFFRPVGYLLAAAVVSLVALAVASRFYLDAWRRAQESVQLSAGGSSGAAESWTRRLLPIPGALGAIIRKDVTVFRREWSQWSQLALLLTLVYVYVMNLRELPLAEYRFALGGLDLMTVFFFLNVAFAGGIVTAVATRFTYPSVSWEGRAIWLVKTAPVSDGMLLRSKFVMSAVPLLVLAAGILFAATQTMEVSPLLRRLAVGTMASFAIGLSALGVGIGALYPRLRARNASEAAASPGGLTFMVLGYFFILATVLIEAGLVRGVQGMQSVGFDWAGRYVGSSVASLVVLHAAVWTLPLWLGARAFKRLED